MDCFRCHQDLQASDGHQLLLVYVAKYVAKWSDSSFQEWMSDSAAANSLARKVLFEYHPLEPEMVLQLCSSYKQWDMGTSSGGKRDLVAPKLGAEAPKHVQLYMDSAWRADEMSFLDFLRKSTDDGDIAQWVKRSHKALPEDRPSLPKFANNTPCRGQIAVVVQYVWRLNDAFYGQWLLMNVPFRDVQEFHFPEIEKRVPERYRNFAAALLTTDRNAWQLLTLCLAHAEAVDAYLARRLDLADEVAGEPENPPAQVGLGRIVFQGHQALLTQQIAERLATTIKARTAALEADA